MSPTMLGASMIGLLDPAIDTNNAGDYIISRSIKSELDNLGIEYAPFSTRGPWGRTSRTIARQCKAFILGGTNILTSNPRTYRQWLFSWNDFPLFRKKTILLGVGWWQYQSNPTLLGRRLINEVLHPHALHSVRDAYTKEKLANLGINCLNTACPTMWALDGLCVEPVASCRRIVATLTDYAREPRQDSEFISALQKRFGEVVLWPQGSRDLAYFRDLDFKGVVLPRTVEALETDLLKPHTGYVGTRLHAGIVSLSLGIPTLIVAVDNRATEIARDTGLPVIQRSRFFGLCNRLEAANQPICVPTSSIDTWKANFQKVLVSAKN